MLTVRGRTWRCRVEWGRRTVAPRSPALPRGHIRHPCPGVCRFTGWISFLAAGIGVYRGGLAAFGLPAMDWAAPHWTAGHIAIVVAAMLLGALAGLVGFAAGMAVSIPGERASDLCVVLWQFLANTTLVWIMVIGIAMSISAGKEEAKAAVLRFGAERAALQVGATGSVLGVLLGIFCFLSIVRRSSLASYLVPALAASLAAAWWHFGQYDLHGRAWIGAGMLLPLVVPFMALPMIERDRRQRRLIAEHISSRAAP